ncbi:MAG TPA: phosphoribosylaminoimidazolesuccinocarboxamide synthase [Geobacterales bacterium]|nr:phosphoribosylaminoimidazolesuccinocarboxamide synthase [Geobacterales bacterium]
MELKLLRRGKVKDVYELDEERLIFIFSDRISAFDVVLPSVVPSKGHVLLKFSEFWFKYLNFPNHMLAVQEPNSMVVKKLRMIPLEFIVRGYIYGSFYERLIKGELKLDVKPILAKKLDKPFFETTTKYEEKDVPISKEEAIERGWINKEDYEFLEKVSINLYEKMYERAIKAGFILADIKFEFGKDKNGEILLADSIGPDEFRLWPIEKYEEGKLQESYDKQPVRDWLIKIGYRDRLEEARRRGEKIPEPPSLPNWLIDEIKRRYVEAYERISGEKIA